MYYVQYSSKRMQCNVCSKRSNIYCIADIAACSTLFFQPQNTANWDAGSNTANECYAHFSGPFITALQIMEGVWQSENRNIICYTKVI